MIIIAGHTKTEAGARDAAVQSLGEMVGRARKHDGCLDFSLSADPVDAARINLFELWRDRESLDAWRKVANPPDIALRETCVKLYHADKAEEPF